jgi:diguanylate cyclase (GGDEF)-like protein/PAS domain S-box-containing protein
MTANDYKRVTTSPPGAPADGLVADNLREIVDALPVAVFVKDVDGRILLMNRACEELWGVRFDDARGSDGSAFFPPEQVERFQAMDRAVLAGGHLADLEHTRRSGDPDADRVVHTFEKPLHDAAGRPLCLIGASLDVTAARRAEMECRTILRTTLDGFWLTDMEGRFLDVNEAAGSMLGYHRDEMLRMSIGDVEAIERPEEIRAHIEKVLAAGYDRFETQHRHKDGRLLDVEITVDFLPVADGRLIVFVRDICARRQADIQLNLYANVFRHSGEGIIITDAANRIIAVNESFTQLTGYTQDEVRGQNPRMLASGKTPREVYQSMWAALNGSGYWQGEVWDRRKDGLVFPKWIAITAVRDRAGATTHYIASFTDISNRKAVEERISYLAHHDALTGLYNRLSLQDRLSQTLLAARREHQEVAVMFIDMDNFKSINDTLGHHVGDGLLVEVARRLQATVRESDIVARLGGDEFVVALAGIEADVASMTVAEKFLRVLGESYLVDGQELHSSPSIGISVFPADGEDGATLMKNADTAMYHAKAQGRNNYQFFTAALNAAATTRMKVERGLRRALAENQLLLHYQPQVDAAGRVCAVEALVRWQHPDEGLMAPGRFIPVAEETGLILPLGEWVLNEACRQLAEWKIQGVGTLRMAVNVSVQQLRSPNLTTQVRTALGRHGLAAAELELEITESAAMDDPERATALLKNLRELGVTLAIDDFGTGYSSLAYLKRLPIQTLKLDRSFVADIEDDADDAAICAATIALGHTLDLKVIAEGVETSAQEYFLRYVHHCDVMQGYLYGRPMPAHELLPFLTAARGAG